MNIPISLCLIALNILINPIIPYWTGRPTTVHALPPRPPVQCGGGGGGTTGCTVSNSYAAWGSDRAECHVANVTYPKTEADLLSAVAHATKNRLKVKVVSKFSHTIPKLVCPGGTTNNNFFLTGDTTFLISTRDFDREVEVDAEGLTATADSGVGLRRLVDEVEAAGLSLAASPYWEGVSVGGVVSTGAHGSSWWGRGGSVHDHVVGVSLVVSAKPSQGYAKVVWLEGQNPLLSAAKVSLGLLGVISKVKFSLEKGFKRSISYEFRDESEIEEKFMEHAKKHEFGDISWYPSQHTAVYRYDDRLPLNASGDGSFDFLGFQPNPILVTQTIRATEKALESIGNSKGKCPLAASVVAVKKLAANGLKNNGVIFTGYPVIGRQGKMQTSGSCLYTPRLDAACAWDPRYAGLFFYESTAAFAATRFGDFLRDVKRLRDLNPSSFCGVDMYNGFLVRYVRASKAYLGQSEDSVVVDFNYFRADVALTPRLNQDVLEEVEQMAFFKYGARPHWAKNRNLAFLGVGKKYPNFARFVEAKRELDPLELFSSEWSDEIVFGKGLGEKKDGCALEGLCVCSEDRHCSPDKGYFCKQGFVYKEARVCRYSQSSVS